MLRSIFYDPNIVLCSLILIGGIFQDLVFRKVKNFYSFLSLVISFLFVTAMTVQLNFNSSLIEFIGNIFLKNFLLALLLTFTLYLFKVIGAGDAKLFVAISFLLPIKAIAPSLFYSLIWGAIFGVILTLISGQFQILTQRFLHILQQLIPSHLLNSSKFFSTSFSPSPNSNQKQLHQSEFAIPFTVPLLLGVLTEVSLYNIGVHIL